MASRLKRLVNRKKDDSPGGRDSDYNGTDLSSIPYDGAATGQVPISGSHPIRGSSDHTSSNFEPDHSARKRRSKRFSQSSLPGFRSRSTDLDTRNGPPPQYDGIPHADALYDSGVQPTQATHHLPQQKPQPVANLVHQSPTHTHIQQREVEPPSTAGGHRHPGIRQVPPSRTHSHEQSNVDDYQAPPPVPLGGNDIIERAQYDTEEIGTAVTTAPAVTHEVIHRHIHHVREEQITRDTHDHDVYHRMLPVVDVEVLPARHFLPAEGGGLLEIEADEAPGRGKHWIIAETAS